VDTPLTLLYKGVIMKKLYLVLVGLFLLIFTLDVFAAEQYACVQYQRKDFSWGDPYKVPAKIITGTQLFEATQEYKYKSYYNYAIVTWPNGGYSALELPSYQDDLPFSYTNTKGQHDRIYRIKKGPEYGACTSY
jgi:hypothetical protein